MSKMPVNNVEAAEWLREHGARWFTSHAQQITAEEAQLEALPFVIAVLMANAIPAYPGDGTGALAGLNAGLVRRAETAEMWNNEDATARRDRIEELLRANNELVERERAAKREAAGWRSIVEDVARGKTGEAAARRADQRDADEAGALGLLHGMLQEACAETRLKPFVADKLAQPLFNRMHGFYETNKDK